MAERKKILIGVPGFMGVQPEAQESFLRMIFRCGRDLPDYDFMVQIVTKSEQFRARNKIVDTAIAADADYLLMLDDDMIVPSDLIKRLLAHDKDIVGAVYWQRGGSFHPVVLKVKYLETGGFHTMFYQPNDQIFQAPGLHPVDVIGGGCMFFKTDVFRHLTPPYFWWEAQLGTDIAICERLREVGFQPYIDTTIELGHLGNKTIITKDEIPIGQQAIGAMKEELLLDARAYFQMSRGEIEQAFIHASDAGLRREKWHAEPRTNWESVRKFYQTEGEWHILNLLYWAMRKNHQMTQWLLTEAQGKLPLGSTILDLGPGIGAPSFHLASTIGYNVVLADITGAPTLEFLKWRKQHREVPDRAIQFREFSTPVPDFEHPVDCVLLMSMLDHCPDAYGTLEWAIRQLSPGGLLLCDYATHTHQEKELEPQHLITYDQHTLVQWLHERGMEESYKYPWMFTRRG